LKDSVSKLTIAPGKASTPTCGCPWALHQRRIAKPPEHVAFEERKQEEAMKKGFAVVAGLVLVAGCSAPVDETPEPAAAETSHQADAKQDSTEPEPSAEPTPEADMLDTPGGPAIEPGDYEVFLAAYKTTLESGLEKRVEQQRSDQEAMGLAAYVCRLINAGEDPARLRLVYSMGAVDPEPTEDMVRDYSAILLAADETLCGHKDD
jgi:hypothetical protein